MIDPASPSPNYLGLKDPRGWAEGEGGRERDRQIETEIETDRQRQTDRHTETATERERQRQRDRHTERLTD